MAEKEHWILNYGKRPTILDADTKVDLLLGDGLVMRNKRAGRWRWEELKGKPDLNILAWRKAEEIET